MKLKLMSVPPNCQTNARSIIFAVMTEFALKRLNFLHIIRQKKAQLVYHEYIARNDKFLCQIQ